MKIEQFSGSMEEINDFIENDIQEIIKNKPRGNWWYKIINIQWMSDDWYRMYYYIYEFEV